MTEKRGIVSTESVRSNTSPKKYHHNPMKHLLASLLLLVPFGAPASAKENPASKPNFIIIFTDDQGYADLGCFGSKTIRTPNIDRMAREGRKFTSFYVACSICTPSRAALVTASYPKRVGLQKGVLFPGSNYGLNPAEYTIGDHFKSLGYATACIGKWHLGHHKETLPTNNGFDSYFGIPYSNDMTYPDNKKRPHPSMSDYGWTHQDEFTKAYNTPLMENDKIIEVPADQRTITRRYTDKAIEFVKAHKDKPFFLYLAHSMPHIPLFVPKDAYDPDPNNAYKCVIEHIDSQVGRLLQTVRDLGLAENTWVVFTSDNGPWARFGKFAGSAKPLRGSKGTTFEGGQREPCVMWAPGRIPAGTTSDAFLCTMDLLPTFANLANSKLPENLRIDGYDASATVTGDAPSPRTEMLYYSPRGALEGIRQGDWKLLVKKPWRRNPKAKKLPRTQILLFNLAKDISEKNNLAAKHPEKVNALRKRMAELDAEITAHARPVWRKKSSK